MRARARTLDGRPVADAVRRIQRFDSQRHLASHVAHTTRRRDHGLSDSDSSVLAYLDELAPVNAGALAAHIAPREPRPS
jgi:hypothetical protein